MWFSSRPVRRRYASVRSSMGKNPTRCAVFGSHVGDGGAIGDGHVIQTFAEELDEFFDDAVAAENLRDREHQIGGCRSFRQFAVQLEADDLRHDHVNRLAEHARLGFDSTDAPAQHAQAVDHGGVAVGADQAVGKRHAVLHHHHRRQVFQIHLMHDARRRRHDAKITE